MRKVYIGDTESSTGNPDGSTNVYLWGFTDLKMKQSYSGVNLTEFFECIDYWEIKQVYFHNLSWDGEFFIHWLVDNGYKFKKEGNGVKLEEGEFDWIKTNMNKYYRITIKTKQGVRLILSDTAVLIPSSVEKMGKVLGFEKQEVDYHKYKHFNSISEVPKELIDYLWRDIHIVVKFYNKFKQVFKSHKMTISSTALDDFKKHYGRLDYVKDFGGVYKTKKGDYIQEYHTKESWYETKKALKGGFTGSNPRFKGKIIDKKGTSYDETSIYPYIMATHLLPYGGRLDQPPMEGAYRTLIKIFIYDTVKIDDLMPPHLHNPAGTKFSKVKYVDRVSNEFYTYTEDELEELKLTYRLVEGIDYKVVKKWYWKAKIIFDSWVEKYKDLKTYADNPVDRLTYKTNLNALFGKTCENFLRGAKKLVYDPDHELFGYRYGNWTEQDMLVESTVYSPIQLGVFITADARVALLRAIRANKENVLYWDTDSMYMIGEAKGIDIHESRFGAWKPELKFNKFCSIKPKAYLAQVQEEYEQGVGWVKKPHLKRAIAGLNRDNHHMVNFENFFSGSIIPNGKKQKKRVKGGYLLVDIKYTL